MASWYHPGKPNDWTLQIHRGPFRLGMKTWRYGVIFKLPFMSKIRAWGAKP